MVESDLFGHVKGSFSGAQENKKRLVEVADGGRRFSTRSATCRSRCR